MIVRQRILAGASGGQAPISVDHTKIPFELTLHVDVVSGTADWTLEFTTDDLQNTEPADMRWGVLDSDLEINRLNTPVTAVRLNVDSVSGEVRFTVIQGTGI